LEIFNSSNHRIGYINRDGTVRDGNSKMIGKINTDGRVTDANYSVIGYANGVKIDWAACIFFFKFFDLK
jgi:hypothetical protein